MQCQQQLAIIIIVWTQQNLHIELMTNKALPPTALAETLCVVSLRRANENDETDNAHH